MNTKTQGSFAQWAADNRGIPQTVTRAVIRQLGGWEEFQKRAPDVAACGAAGGFAGFTYFTDTVPFARRIRDGLFTMLENFAEDIGDKGGAPAVIASFNMMDLTAGEVARALYARADDNATQVYNALAWYALEEVARAYVDATEDQD